MADTDFLFSGGFDFSHAYNDMRDFFKAFKAELRNVNDDVAKGLQSGSKKTDNSASIKAEQRAIELYTEALKKQLEAEKQINKSKVEIEKAVQAGKITVGEAIQAYQKYDDTLNALAKRLDRVAIKQDENIKLTKADVIALRQLGDEYDNIGLKIKQVDDKLATSNRAWKESQQRFDTFFKGLVVGGFGLQQLGGTLNLFLTQPMITGAKAILDTLFVFDEFEQKLIKVGKRTKEQADAVRKTVFSVAKEPNLELLDVTKFFGKIIDATAGKFDDKKFDVVGRGLARVMGGVESGERNSFLGQLVDILGGGDVAGIEKTLNLAPRLKAAMQDIVGGELTKENLAKKGKNQTDILLEALEKLSKETATDSIENKFKNLSDTFVALGLRIGTLYKGELENFIQFVEKRVIPILDRWITQLEEGSPQFKGMILLLTGMTAALAPLAFVLGTLGVVGGGIWYLIQSIGAALGIVTTQLTLTTTATGVMSGTVSTASSGALAGLLEVISGISASTVGWAAVIGAVVLALGYVIATGEKAWQEILRFAQVFTAVKDIAVNLGRILLSLFGIVKNFLDRPTVKWIIDGGLAIVFRIAYLTVLPMVEALKTVAFILDAIASGLETGSWGVFWTTLKIGVEESMQSITEAIPYLAEFTDWLAKAFDQPTRAEKIAKLKAELAKLKEGTQNLNQQTAENTKLGEESSANNQRRAAAVAQLTEEIKKQTEALKKLQEQEQEQQDKNADAEQERVTNRATAKIDRSVEGVDLTTEEGQRKAREAAQAKYNLARRDLIKRLNRDNEQEWTRFLQEMNLEIINKSQEVQDALLKQQLLNIAEQVSKGTTPLKYAILEDEQSRQVLDSLAQNYADRLNTKRKEIVNRKDELTKLVDNNEQEREKLEEEIRVALNELEKEKQETQILGVIRKYEKQITLEDIAIEKMLASAENIVTKYKQVAISRDKIKNAQLAILKQQNNLEKTKATNSQGVLSQIDKERLDRDYDTGKSDIENKTNLQKQKDEAKMLKELADLEKENRDKAFKLTQQIMQKNDAYEEVITNLQGKGINLPLSDSGYITLVKEAVSDIAQLSNIRLPDQLINSITKAGIGFEGWGKALTDKNVSLVLNDMVELLMLLQEASNGNQKFSNEDRASITAYLQKINALAEKFLIVHKAAKSEIEKTAQSERRIALGKKETNLDELKQKQEILDLEDKIAEARRAKGYVPDVSSLRDFMSSLYGIITNGADEAYARQKKSLELEKDVALLELDIAIERLKIEQEITLEKLKGLGRTEDELKLVREQYDKQIKQLNKKRDLTSEVFDEEIRSLSKYGSNLGQILIGATAKGLKGLFKKKGDKTSPKDEKDKPAVSDEATKATETNAQTQMSWIDKLSGKMGMMRDIAQAVGGALMQLNDLSLQSILKVVQAELDALASKAVIKSLEYAAIALSALVFGDFETARKAGIASASWLLVAGGAKAGSALAGLGIKDKQTAQATSDAQAGTSSSQTERKRIVKQKALELTIVFDVRKDRDLTVKTQANLLKQNTPLTTLAGNTQVGFSFPVNP